MPRFSILIPAYKSEYLKKSIDSILAQTYNNFELIIVDDASPNNINEIVDSYIDKRIKYYRNETNCGAINVVDNWNICLGYAKGEYVICMGDDDMLTEDTLMEYDKMIKKYPEVDVLHARVVQVDENDSPIRILFQRAEYESALSFLQVRLEGYHEYIGDFCYKACSLKNAGGFYKLPLAWGSDDITALRAAERHGIVNLQKTTFLYRISQSTISSTGNINIKLDSFLKHKQWCKELLNRYQCIDRTDELTRDRCLKIIDMKFNTWMRNELNRIQPLSLFDCINCYKLAKRYSLLAPGFKRHLIRVYLSEKCKV